MDNFEKNYNEPSFWKKLKDNTLKAGSKVIFIALELFYTYQKDDVPKWAKAVIIGALGYFIALIDAIPDITPITGYSDDLGVLVLAVSMVAKFMDKETHRKAKEKYKELFKREYEEKEEDEAA